MEKRIPALLQRSYNYLLQNSLKENKYSDNSKNIIIKPTHKTKIIILKYICKSLFVVGENLHDHIYLVDINIHDLVTDKYCMLNN